MTTAEMLQSEWYGGTIGSLKKDMSNKRNLEKKVKHLTQELYENQNLYTQMIDAQKLLSTVSDDNTEKTLDFITGLVNKALVDIFPVDTPKIKLKKTLYAGSKPHIDVELVDGDGNILDMTLQSGTGLRQVVSFMFAICLIEIRKGRRFIILDERLNGLHKEAKRILSEIIKIFADAGFQFIFVEYSLNDLGKIYNVEKRGDESRIVPLDAGERYDDNIVYFEGASAPDLSNLEEVDDGEDCREKSDMEENDDLVFI